MTFRNDFSDELNTYFKDIDKVSKPLTKDEEMVIWGHYYATTDEYTKQMYKEKIINSNLRYIIKIASRYRGRGLTLHELICEGNIGLCKAFDKFNPSENVRFLSYAIWWVKDSIVKSIQRHNKIPMTDIEQTTEQGNFEVHSAVPQRNYITSDIDPYFEEKIELVMDVLRGLPERERNIILDLYDFNGKGGKNLKTIAPRHNLSPERVRQLRNAAITKIREVINIKDYNKTINF